MPNKGKPTDVLAGITDRKTKGPFMIALAYQNRAKPIIGTVPILPPIQTPPLFIQPPKVIKFQQNITQVDSTTTTLPWLVDCCVHSVINLPALQLQANYTPASILHLNNHSKHVSYHLISRLPIFLQDRLPPSRPDLFPGSHWVWNSLRKQMKTIVTIMIVNKHVCDKDELKFKTENECLLSHRIHFNSSDSESLEYDPDGSYIVYDKNREVFIRAGAAIMGIIKRWREHVSASMLTNDASRKSVLYKSYPNSRCTEDDLPLVKRKGEFEQLEQLIGISFDRRKMEKIVSLFEWNDEELFELNKLKGLNPKDTIIDKQYRHICYLTESVYALAISNSMNISSNPGFEWQLRYYGR